MTEITIKIYRAKDIRDMTNHVCVADLILNKNPDQPLHIGHNTFLQEVYRRTENHFFENGWFNEPYVTRFDTTAPLGTRSNMVGDIYALPYLCEITQRSEVLYYRIASCGFDHIESLTDLPERNYL